MYVTMEQARVEIRNRWNDLSLHRRVREYVGDVPAFFRSEPRAVLARHLATPNHECFRFAEAAGKTGLKPLCSEYTGDKFCTQNPDKLLLGKMTFFHGKGRNNGDKSTSHKVIDINTSNRKPLSMITTQWGEDFVGFHHRLLATRLPGIETGDSTDWLRSMGGKPDQFWHRHLALYVCHGILFENFHTDGHEATFTRDIIQPAMNRIENHFGIKPLVVPLVPVDREREPYWSWYPAHLEQEITSSQPRPAAHRGRVRPSNRPTQSAGERHGG